jgi:predicted Holliday junction resolvase-like endonuclease
VVSTINITDIIPQSINDIGAILFWIIILVLIILIILLYLNGKRLKKKIVKMQQELDTHVNTAKQTKEKRMADLSEVKNKVDKILLEEKDK